MPIGDSLDYEIKDPVDVVCWAHFQVNGGLVTHAPESQDPGRWRAYFPEGSSYVTSMEFGLRTIHEQRSKLPRSKLPKSKLDMGWHNRGSKSVAFVRYRKQFESRCCAASTVSSCLGTC